MDGLKVETDRLTEREPTGAQPETAQPESAAQHRLRFWAIVSAMIGCIVLAVAPLVMMADRDLSASVRGGDVPGDVRKAIELSEAFAHGSGVTVILVAILLVCHQRRAAVWAVVAMTALSGITANILKAAFTRARPYTYDSDTGVINDVTGWEFLGTGRVWDASQHSFPSGHTATAWALCFGLCLLFPRGSVVFVLVAMLATYQRLYSGAHFPSDTVAGFGIACLACSLVLSMPRVRGWLSMQPTHATKLS